MSEPRKILIIGGSEILPPGLVDKLREVNCELISEEEYAEIKPCPSLENFELVVRPIPQLDQYRVHGSRLGKGEKRRMKKLRGW